MYYYKREQKKTPPYFSFATLHFGGHLYISPKTILLY